MSLTTDAPMDSEAPPLHVPQPRSPRLDFLLVILLIGLVWLVLLPESPLARLLPSRDSGMFLYGGQLLNRGGNLYIDFWDHKPPLIFLLNALGLTLGGSNMLGVYILEALCLAAAVFFSFRILRQPFGAAAAFFATAGWSTAMIYILEGNQIEEWALPLQFGALYFFMLGERRERGGWPLMLTGALVGLAFFLRPNMIGIGLAIGAFLVLRLLVTRQRHDDLRILQAIVGGLAVVLVMLAGAALGGILNEMWFATLTYNTLYAQNIGNSRFTALEFGLNLLMPSALPVIVPVGWVAAVGVLLVKRRSNNLSPLLLVALIGLPVEVFFATMSGRRYEHYFVALLPVFAILAAYVAHVIFAALRRSERVRRAAWVVPLCALLFTVGVTVLPLREVVTRIQARLPAREFGAVYQVINYVRANTQPGDTVLVWGAIPFINFITDRPAPSRYFFMDPLFLRGFGSSAVYTLFRDEVRASAPVLIIDTGLTDTNYAPLAPNLRAQWMERINGRIPSVYAPPEMDMLFSYFNQNYEKIAAFDFGWEVYAPLDAVP